MPLADFRRVIDVNAVGCWLGMKSVVEPMKAAGGGSIVNISSIEGLTGAAHCTAYAASKFAIRGMTKAAAQELGEFGIRVNSVHPGGIITKMIFESAETLDPERGERYYRGTAAWPVRQVRRGLPAWSRSSPAMTPPTAPAASSWPTAASCPGLATKERHEH